MPGSAGTTDGADPGSGLRSSPLTVAAIAVAATCIVTIDHEAIGHGAACLATGGRIARLTSVYFDCTQRATAVAAGGPVANLAGGLMAWLLLQRLPRARPRAGLLLALVVAFALFWEAGYLIKAMVMAEGDAYFVASDLIGPPGWWRAAGVVAGLLLYWLAIRATRAAALRFRIPAQTLRIGWFAASAAAVLAAANYAPGRLAAMGQAALEIGVASWPLVVMSRRLGTTSVDAGEAVHGAGWVAGAAVFYVLFVATLGHGMP